MRYRLIKRFSIGILLICFAASSMSAYGDTSCENAEWGPPLENEVEVSDAFDVHSNPDEPHRGVDYKAADGDNLLAVADGEIIWIDYNIEDLEKPHSRTGLMIKGWGWNVVVKHSDGSVVRYAHLLESSIDKSKINMDLAIPVAKGDVIGLADSSGGVSGSHLHLEYFSNGKHWVKEHARDPDPCVPKKKTCYPDAPTPTFSCTGGACDETLKNSSKQFVLENTQGAVTWSSSGGNIDSSGLLTTDSSACGNLTITAKDSCGPFEQKVRVTDGGYWVQEPIMQSDIFCNGCNWGYIWGFTSCQVIEGDTKTVCRGFNCSTGWCSGSNCSGLSGCACTPPQPSNCCFQKIVYKWQCNP